MSNGEYSCGNKATRAFYDGFKIDFGDVWLKKSAPLHGRFVFGPTFENTAVEFENTLTNLAMGATRLTSVRKPEIPGLHQRLIDNQFENISRRPFPELLKWKAFVAERLAFRLDQIDDHFEAFVKYVRASHPKVKLREAALREIFDNCIYFKKQWVDSVTMKLKLNDYNKAHKKPRVIIDLGVVASLQSGYLVNHLKEVMSEPYITDDIFMEFIKTPDIDKMTEAFKHLMSPSKRLVVYYFSDDNCYSVQCEDGVMMGNGDIACCDGSVGDPVFDLVSGFPIRCSDTRSLYQSMVDQCALPLSIFHPRNKSVKMKLRAHKRHLYSGSTGTTVCDNVATCCIFTSLSSILTAHVRRADVPRLLSEAAEKVGFLVTTDICENPRQLQFLKHSPVLNTLGVWTCVENLGVILRMMGQKSGTFVYHKLGLAATVYKFNRGLVSGLKHAGNHVVTTTLRRLYLVTEDTPVSQTNTSYLLSHVTGSPVGYIADEEIFARYLAPSHEVTTFLDLLDQVGDGTSIRCRMIDRIMKVDYGYEPFLHLPAHTERVPFTH